MDLSPKMFRDIPKLAADHYKEGNLNYPMIIYISLVHIVAIAGIFAVPKCSYETLLWAFILWPIRYVRCRFFSHYDRMRTPEHVCLT